MKNALLIIDMQNDFCLPTGALSVAGAMNDVTNVAEFIKRNKTKLGYIGLTMDSHNPIDVSHPCFWQDKDGNFPSPFTGIATDFPQEVKEGKWSPRFFPAKAIKYLEDLHSQGEFKHTIWPEHCVVGSPGAAIVKEIIDAVTEWEHQGMYKDLIFKGSHPLTEHYGAFRANIPIPAAPETQVNDELLKTLEEFENVYFAGEASSHCVANTLKQVMEIVPALAKRFVILTDCMSPVTGCEHMADKIFDDAKALGVRFAVSTDPIL